MQAMNLFRPARERIRAGFAAILAGAALLASGAWAATTINSAPVLKPCPASPNCVSSDSADDNHAVAPLKFNGHAEKAWQAAKDALLTLPRTRIVADTGQTLHAECRSAVFGFVDDVEFELRADQGIIAVRSASRVGYSDFGVNRRRIETVRAAFNERIAGK
jgi:uncharacterized protein (DUF1499 family)